jgi:hypothetical protein
MRIALVSRLAVVTVVAVGCSSDKSPAATDPGKDSGPKVLAPTFANVYSQVISKNGCAVAQCHGAFSLGNLKMDSRASAYKNLVGQKAAGPCITDAGSTPDGAMTPNPGANTTVCGCAPSGKTRVVPGNPDDSLLVQKLSDNTSCGDRMPPTGLPLSEEAIDLVTKWIAAGAEND